MPKLEGPPYLQRITLRPERVANRHEHPFSLPIVHSLDLEFRASVTFLIGENGCGKSTLLEAIAGSLLLPLSGGGTADRGLQHGPRRTSKLADAVRLAFRRRPMDSYFFRGEYASQFGELLDERRDDPDFRGDPYARYGGKSLLVQSHGEGFLGIMRERIEDGLYLLDEPEVALSPKRQLALMSLLAARARAGAQFIVATHSPMLMTVPNAEILEIADGRIDRVALEATDHYQLTRAVLANPEAFWRHLVVDD